jgi:TonB family protein
MELLEPKLFDMLAALGRWSLEAFWLPLLVWTVIALPAYAAVRFGDDRSPHVRYRTLIALLFSLPIGLAAAAIAFFDSTSIQGIAFVTLPAATTVTAEPASSATLLWTRWHSAGAVMTATGLLALWRGGVLAYGLFELRGLRSLAGETPSWIVEETRRTAGALGLRRHVDVCVRTTPSPFTVGWIRPLIVLPRELTASQRDLQLALTHELIHIRRSDFGLQVAEHLIGAVFYVHPLVALIRRKTAVLREITCDADVVARTGQRSAYARVLCRYSTSKAGERMFAVGIFSREHQLPQRIRAITSYFSERGITRSRQKGAAVFALLLCVAVAAVACSDMLVESDAETVSRAAQVSGGAEGEDTFVVVEQMPELIGGLASIQENLRYPELARKAGIEGRVIVQFVVDEEGRVVDPEIVRGVGSGLDTAALEAVRTAAFKPGMQRGVPVRVKMSLPVTFILTEPDGTGEPATAPTVLLRIDENDRLFVNGSPVEVGELVAALRERRLGPEDVVALRVDAAASMGMLSDVQDVLRSSAVRKIEYASERPPVLVR